MSEGANRGDRGLGNQTIMRNRTIQHLVLLVVMAILAGCQSNQALTSVRYDNVRFMDVWSTYTHCLSVEDSRAALQDSTKLHEVSRAQRAGLNAPAPHWILFCRPV